MSLPEIPISLTRQQAAAGVVLTVPLAVGSVQVRIPPTRDGDLVRAWVDGQEVLLRIRVIGADRPVRKVLTVLGAVAALVFVVVLIDSGGGDGDTVGSPGSTSSYEPYSPDPTYYPYTEDPSTDDPYTDDPYTQDPFAEETVAPDPFESGTCLNGTLPDSTVAQPVYNVDEVSCSASDAHYKVIQRFSFTSDMSMCDANPRTQYAFSYSYTLNGAAINEYVYCLIGLGSYAR
ncbi:LppU/SCO3897 family protein [Streptomyces sp. NPDC001858]